MKTYRTNIQWQQLLQQCSDFNGTNVEFCQYHNIYTSGPVNHQGHAMVTVVKSRLLTQYNLPTVIVEHVIIKVRKENISSRHRVICES